jgi:hypothetical protein
VITVIINKKEQRAYVKSGKNTVCDYRFTTFEIEPKSRWVKNPSILFFKHDCLIGEVFTENIELVEAQLNV